MTDRGTEGNADKGREIFSTKSMGNCVSCHQVSQLSDVPFQGEVGPPLGGVGEYRSAAELRGIVANAKMTFEGTVILNGWSAGVTFSPTMYTTWHN